MGFSTFLIRSVGVAGVGVLGYDTLIRGRNHAMRETRTEIADDLTDVLVRNIATGNGSHITEAMRNKYMKWNLDDNIIPTIQYAKNRTKSTFGLMVSNAIGFGLALCAMGAHSTSKFRLYKGFIPKPVAAVSAIGLGLLGALSTAKNVFGVGDHHKGI